MRNLLHRYLLSPEPSILRLGLAYELYVAGVVCGQPKLSEPALFSYCSWYPRRDSRSQLLFCLSEIWALKGC